MLKTIAVVKLHEVVSALPPNLTYDQFSDLVGNRLVFTAEEAEDIIRRGKALQEPIPEVVEAPLVIETPVEATYPQEEVEEPPKSSYVKVGGESICKALLERSLCGAPIENKGTNGTGFCEDCWHPTIVDQYEEYNWYRKEGYQRNEAALMAGILLEPEKKRVGTYATKSDRKERSDTFTI